MGRLPLVMLRWRLKVYVVDMLATSACGNDGRCCMQQSVMEGTGSGPRCGLRRSESRRSDIADSHQGESR